LISVQANPEFSGRNGRLVQDKVARYWQQGRPVAGLR